MKRIFSNILTKVLIVALLIYAAVSLVSMGKKIMSAEGEKQLLEEKVENLENENSELKYAIDNSDNKKVIEDIARAELGLFYPGEKVFIGD